MSPDIHSNAMPGDTGWVFFGEPHAGSLLGLHGDSRISSLGGTPPQILDDAENMLGRIDLELFRNDLLRRRPVPVTTTRIPIVGFSRQTFWRSRSTVTFVTVVTSPAGITFSFEECEQNYRFGAWWLGSSRRSRMRPIVIPARRFTPVIIRVDW